MYQDFAWAVKNDCIYSANYQDGKVVIESTPRCIPTLEEFEKDLASGRRIKMTEKEFIARAKAWLRR